LNIFDKDSFHIKISFGDKPGKVISFSKNAPGIFKYDKIEFEYISSVNDLIPNIVNQGK
jgi:hypothetical protein